MLKGTGIAGPSRNERARLRLSRRGAGTMEAPLGRQGRLFSPRQCGSWLHFNHADRTCPRDPGHHASSADAARRLLLAGTDDAYAMARSVGAASRRVVDGTGDPYEFAQKWPHQRDVPASLTRRCSACLGSCAQLRAAHANQTSTQLRRSIGDGNDRSSRPVTHHETHIASITSPTRHGRTCCSAAMSTCLGIKAPSPRQIRPTRTGIVPSRSCRIARFAAASRTSV